MQPAKKQLGRPPAPPEQKLTGRNMRLNAGQWAKIDEYGMEWLRRLIDRAKGPKG